MDSPRWAREGAETRVLEHSGRQALFLRNGFASIGDANFDTGVIEFDIMVDGTRGFPGVFFRGQDNFNAENFYIRPHQGGNPDANQYQPLFNGVAAWQILYGTEYAQPTPYRLNEWMHIRLEVATDSARVYIDSEAPSLVIHDLKRDRAPGYIALSDGGAGVYFSNFSFTPGPIADVAEPEPQRELPTGLVRRWAVSPAMAEADAFAAAAANRLQDINWSPLAVESIGIANLARVGPRAQATPTVLARISVNSDRVRTVRMQYGFSDRVRVFANGTPLADGADGYLSRDYRFLGTVGLFDAVHLPLRRGRNEIVLAVSENFGGWAAMAAFDDMTGLTVLEPE